MQAFNLSHSHGLAVYAFALGREVGIDLEPIRPDFVSDDIAGRYFSTQELNELRALSPESGLEGFFLCWTSKEAYVKARGEGLQIPLESFSVSLTPGQREVLESADSSRWGLHSFQPAPRYVAAIVGEGKAGHFVIVNESRKAGRARSNFDLTRQVTVDHRIEGGEAGIEQFTGGEGAVTGEEVRFNLTFTTPLTVGADHIFFRPEVGLTNGDFLWLSAPKPIVSPGTPFAADLQSWTRNDGAGSLAPDWERIGTDVTNQGPFNAAFSISGETVPEPSSLLLLGTGLSLLVGVGWGRKQRMAR